MKLLMCKEGKDNHSYVYVCNAKGEWEFKKNGFYYAGNRMSDDKLMGMVQTARAEATVQHFPDLVHLGTGQALFETKTWSQVQFKCNSSEPQVQFYSSKWLT